MVSMIVVRSGVILSGSVLALCVGSAFASPDTLQPPPGPITGTFKTLAEVEPRVVVNARNTPGNAGATYIISQPGSYYLDRTLVGETGKIGIRITITNVTLDLNGFSMTGAGTGTVGIAIESNEAFGQIAIRNGRLIGWSQSAIAGSATRFTRPMLEGLRVYHVGSQLAVRNMNSAEIVDCDINALGFGGALACEDASLVRSRFSGGTTALDSRIRSCVFTVSSTGTNAITLGTTNTGLPGSVFVDNEVYANVGGNGLLLQGRGHVVTNNRIVGDGTGNIFGGIGLRLDASAVGVTLRDNTVAGFPDNYRFDAPPTANNQLEITLSEIPETFNVPAFVKLAGTPVMPAGSTASAITVAASDVTIDFAGGGISGSPTAGNGVVVTNNARNLRVMNGTISGFNAGIVINDGAGATGSDCIIDNMRIRNNRREAVLGGNVLRMTNCTITVNGPAAVPTVRAGDGSTIENVSLAGNTNTGPVIQLRDGGTVRGCTVQANSGTGIEVENSSTVEDNTVANNGGAGIVGGFGTRIVNNTIRLNQTEGIRIFTSGLVRGNKLDFNARATGSQAGILMQGSANVVEGNSVTASDLGIVMSAGTTNNIVIGNHASSNATNYVTVAGNTWGPIVVVTGVGDLSAIAGSNHPQANFSH